MLYTQSNDLSSFYAEKRIWQGIPGIEITKKGRIFSTFYSGGRTEEFGNYCVVLLSDDDGKTFSEPVCAAYDGEKDRCYDPCLWIDPCARLWFIWASSYPELGIYYSVCENPDENELNWTEPTLLGHDVMMNKPVVLTNGEWLFPCAVWKSGVNAGGMKNNSGFEQLAYAYRSSDNGKTIEQLGGADADKRSYDEHMILELKDGTLAMYIRTQYGIAISYSKDKGNTWSYGQDSTIWGPNSRFHIRRLPSGNILLINHLKAEEGNGLLFGPRNNLAAMISKDEGKTWEGFLMIDERNNVSYPDVALSEDGFIYITYDRERGAVYSQTEDYTKYAKEILMAKVTEEDIVAGKIIHQNSRLKSIINKI
jgi:BNR/Asp-box repeat.